MADDDYGTSGVDSIHESGGDGTDGLGTSVQGNAPDKKDHEYPEHVRSYVKGWLDRIASARKFHEKAFRQMDECMEIATYGANFDWRSNPKNYIVPVLSRIINVDVAQLYARNPRALSKRKERMMYTVWDGNLASLREAESALQQAPQMGMPPDPNQIAVMKDVENVRTYDLMMDRVAKTLTILHNHFMEDPAEQYKSQFKALVRRVKTLGVGYVRLGFQRLMEKQPDITAKIDETTQQVATTQRLMEQMSEDEIPEGSSGIEELRTTLAALQSKEELIVKEGPFWAFPGAKKIILDPATKHLKTLLGCGWLAEEFDLTPDDILENYKVDIGTQFTEYKSQTNDWERWSENAKDGVKKASTARCYRVMSKKTGTEFVLCEGYPGYIQPPAPPKIRIPRFFDIFPLVFNEIENDKELFPPSDIWLARHMQFEYNRTREFLREHRQQNRPAYIAPSGAFEEEDTKKLQAHESGEIILLNGLSQGEKISDKLQGKPTMQIDPKQYEVESIYSDILRVTGAQQANLGQTSGSTATESSIAEESRQVDTSDSKDDLDEFLSLLVQSTGTVMLLELTADTVKSIVGPGAEWPQMPQTRSDIADEISLQTRAGASGRPNAAQDLSKLERAMPYLLQLPGINPVPLAQRYTDTLDLDIEDTVVEGLPSIQTVNTMASQPPPPPPPPPDNNMSQDHSQQHDNSVHLHVAPAKPPTPQATAGALPGSPQAPGMQGPQGAHNAPVGPANHPPPQPGMPSPLMRVQRSIAGNAPSA